jgi:hypothetical protein
MPDVLQPPSPPQSQPQQVFYSLTPEPEAVPVPLYKKRHFGMIVGAVVVAMIVGGFIIAFTANMIQANRQAKAVVAEKKTAVADMVNSGVPQSDAARAVGFADGCNGLTGPAFADCLSLIAIDSGSAEACASLEGAEKISCTDVATSTKAVLDKKYSLCETVVDLAVRAGCEVMVTDKARLANDCSGFGVPESECRSTATAVAVASGDIKACDAVPIETRAGCLDGFNSVDTDADGLSDGEELTKYFTDPKNPDTDGDGYTDGAEVASGHDPLKK